MVRCERCWRLAGNVSRDQNTLTGLVRSMSSGPKSPSVTLQMETRLARAKASLAVTREIERAHLAEHESVQP